MTRRDFGGNGGVIVGGCPRHAVWFDIGEFPRVMAFVEKGALAHIEALGPQAQRHSPSPGRSVSPIAAMGPVSVSGGTDLLDDLTEPATALLEFVARTLQR